MPQQLPKQVALLQLARLVEPPPVAAFPGALPPAPAMK
jgi:hypothetical protein